MKINIKKLDSLATYIIAARDFNNTGVFNYLKNLEITEISLLKCKDFANISEFGGSIQWTRKMDSLNRPEALKMLYDNAEIICNHFNKMNPGLDKIGTDYYYIEKY